MSCPTRPGYWWRHINDRAMLVAVMCKDSVLAYYDNDCFLGTVKDDGLWINDASEHGPAAPTSIVKKFWTNGTDFGGGVYSDRKIIMGTGEGVFKLVEVNPHRYTIRIRGLEFLGFFKGWHVEDAYNLKMNYELAERFDRVKLAVENMGKPHVR